MVTFPSASTADPWDSRFCSLSVVLPLVQVGLSRFHSPQTPFSFPKGAAFGEPDLRYLWTTPENTMRNPGPLPKGPRRNREPSLEWEGRYQMLFQGGRGAFFKDETPGGLATLSWMPLYPWIHGCTSRTQWILRKGGAGVDLEGLRRKNGGLNIIKIDCMHARNSKI